MSIPEGLEATSATTLYDVCNDYSLDKVLRPGAIDDVRRDPRYQWHETMWRSQGETCYGCIGTHREYDEVHYFIGPDGMQGTESPTLLGQEITRWNRSRIVALPSIPDNALLGQRRMKTWHLGS